MARCVTRREVLRLGAAGLAAAVMPQALARAATSAVGGAASKDCPNLIFILVDDTRWAEYGYHGLRQGDSITPNLDALSKRCVVFTRMYAPQSCCAPSRGAFLTGRHSSRWRATSANSVTPTQEITLAEVLRDAGYATAHFGKIHMGDPKGHGFDYAYSIWNSAYVPKVVTAGEDRAAGKGFTRNGRPVDMTPLDGKQGYTEQYLMDEAVGWIRDQAKAGRPFFACIWFLAQHDPHSCIEPYLGRCGGNPRLAELNFIDDQVGRLKRLLADLGAAENTILLYSGDNGMGGEPFIGGKRTLDEGGFIVPGLLDWPAKFKEGRKIDAAASGMDMFPTLLEYLDLTSPDPKRPLDGVSLVPLIEGRAKERGRPIPLEWCGEMAVVEGRYKYRYLPPDCPAAQGMGRKKGAVIPPPVRLLDVVADTRETTDISAARPDVVKRLEAFRKTWWESVQATLAGADYPLNVPKPKTKAGDK